MRSTAPLSTALFCSCALLLMELQTDWVSLSSWSEQSSCPLEAFVRADLCCMFSCPFFSRLACGHPFFFPAPLSGKTLPTLIIRYLNPVSRSVHSSNMIIFQLLICFFFQSASLTEAWLSQDSSLEAKDSHCVMLLQLWTALVCNVL